MNVLFIPDFPHSTHEGYELGCRSNGGCEGKDLITCNEAHRRYISDYSFQRMVLAGMTPAEIIAADNADAIAAAVTSKAERMKLVYSSRGKRELKPLEHGTFQMFNRGCSTDDACPNEETCRMVYNAHKRAERRKQGMKPRKMAAHGTMGGYKSFPCRDQTTCPAPNGITCTQAATADATARKRARTATEKAA